MPKTKGGVKKKASLEEIVNADIAEATRSQDAHLGVPKKYPRRKVRTYPWRAQEYLQGGDRHEKRTPWWYRRNTTERGVRAPNMAQVAMQDLKTRTRQLEITDHLTEKPQAQDHIETRTKAKP